MKKKVSNGMAFETFLNSFYDENNDIYKLSFEFDLNKLKQTKHILFSLILRILRCVNWLCSAIILKDANEVWQILLHSSHAQYTITYDWNACNFSTFINWLHRSPFDSNVNGIVTDTKCLIYCAHRNSNHCKWLYTIQKKCYVEHSTCRSILFTKYRNKIIVNENLFLILYIFTF